MQAHIQACMHTHLQVYFLEMMHFWNFMSWDKKTQKEDNKCAVRSFDVHYSLNGTLWFPMGRVEGLTEVSSTGTGVYFGENIQNEGAGGRATLPRKHRKAVIVPVKKLFGPPCKFLKFLNLDNFGSRAGGNAYGINAVLFYGRAATGDCVLQGEPGAGLLRVPDDLWVTYQFVLNLDLRCVRLLLSSYTCGICA
jgi:hypothetical protein